MRGVEAYLADLEASGSSQSNYWPLLHHAKLTIVPHPAANKSLWSIQRNGISAMQANIVCGL
jgi:hypothetical protein